MIERERGPESGRHLGKGAARATAVCASEEEHLLQKLYGEILNPSGGPVPALSAAHGV